MDHVRQYLGIRMCESSSVMATWPRGDGTQRLQETELQTVSGRYIHVLLKQAGYRARRIARGDVDRGAGKKRKNQMQASVHHVMCDNATAADGCAAPGRVRRSSCAPGIGTARHVSGAEA